MNDIQCFHMHFVDTISWVWETDGFKFLREFPFCVFDVNNFIHTNVYADNRGSMNLSGNSLQFGEEETPCRQSSKFEFTQVE